MDSVKLGTILKMNKGKKPVAQSKIPKEGYLPYCDIKAFETGKLPEFISNLSLLTIIKLSTLFFKLFKPSIE